MFNLNEGEGISRNVESLANIVDEIVIVDSSAFDEYEKLVRSLEGSGAIVYRTIPMGFVDPLRPFGLSKVKSDFVFLLDADEETSEHLKLDLRNLTEFDAYVLPRLEIQLRSYSYHLRIFRRAAIRYSGRSFDFPRVTGRIGYADRAHRIIHHADYRKYFDDKARAERYFTIENVERPFSRRYLKELLSLRLGGKSVSFPLIERLRNDPGSRLSSPAVRAVIELEFLRDFLLGKGLRAALFSRRYSLAKWQFLCALPEPDRRRLAEIADDLEKSGGLFDYLGLNDPAYVERLTASFQWNLRGIDVYRNILDYRFRVGKPPSSVPRGGNEAGRKTPPAAPRS
jgi:hypothetical protein